MLYYDATNSRLKLLRCADLFRNAGNAITPLELGGPVGSHSSLALDVRGNRVIGYVDAQRGGLHVLHCGNPSCTAGNATGAPGAAREVGQHNALVLDASGRPVLSYYDAGSRGLKMVHCHDVNCN